MDYSTLNQEKLTKLPEYKGPHRVSDQLGSACFLNPPGHPSYFLRAIWNSRGDSPQYGPNMVIRDVNGVDRVVLTANDWHADVSNKKLGDLWVSLPIGHERTQAWIKYVYGYMNNMYLDESIPAEKRSHVDQMIVKSSKNVDRCTPENSAAVNYIRKFYPDHQVDLELLDNSSGYGSAGPGSWWETEAKKPTPEKCNPRSCGPHPVNGNWCQWCGWKA